MHTIMVCLLINCFVYIKTEGPRPFGLGDCLEQVGSSLVSGLKGAHPSGNCPEPIILISDTSNPDS